MERKEYLIRALERNSIAYDDIKIEALLTYYDMLIDKNKVMNLTAITEFEEVVIKHFIDSLAINKVVKLKDQKIIDVGTGAGFPGIPIKIFFPETNIVLLDSLNKRLDFLNTVIRELGLGKIETVHARAEEAARKEIYREQFDIAVSRAVANLSTLTEFCLPFVKIGGQFISYKGSKAEEELGAAEKAIQILGGGKVSNTEFVIEGSDINRSFICIEKKKSTSKTYPRAGGKPLKCPL